MNYKFSIMLLMLFVVPCALADTQFLVGYSTVSNSVSSDTYTHTILPNTSLVLNTTYTTRMTSASGSTGNVRSTMTFTYNDSTSYTTPVVEGASSAIIVNNPYPAKRVNSLTWYVYRNGGSSISVGLTVVDFWVRDASPTLYISVNNTFSGQNISNFCVSGSATGLNSSCVSATSNIEGLVNPNSAGINGQTRYENYMSLTQDAYDARFNTTKTFSNGTHTMIAVPWYNSATACGVSNIKTYGSFTTVNMTRFVMVTDELSEACLVTAFSNQTDKIDQYYNTINYLRSASYGTLPYWIVGLDISTTNSPSLTVISSDTASDGSARLVQCLYAAANNNLTATGNQTKYRTLANQMSADHLRYETVTGSYSSAYGAISRLPMTGGNCAGAGVGNAQGTTGCTVDFNVGYFKDVVKAMVMAYAQTTNTSYLTAAEDYIKAYLSVSLQYDRDGDGFGVAPFNFNWNTTGNLQHSGGTGVNNYHYNLTYPTVNAQWDDSDAVRDRTCDALRPANITIGSLSGVWTNLTNYCRAKSHTSTFTNTTSCLQYFYNGTCAVALQGGYYYNGLGGLDHTYYNSSFLQPKLDEALSHYQSSTKTFDSTSCGNALTYRGVRPLILLAKAIGLDDAIYIPSGTSVCSSGNTGTFTSGGVSIALNNPGNGSQTTYSSVSLSVTAYNNNATGGASFPGRLPQVLANYTFCTNPATQGFTMGSGWTWDSVRCLLKYNGTNFQGNLFTPNLSLSQYTNGYNISVTFTSGNISLFKYHYMTRLNSLDNAKFNQESENSTHQHFKFDGGGFSQTDNYDPRTTNITIDIFVNVTGNTTKACRRGGSCTSSEGAQISVLGDYFGIQGAETSSGIYGLNISNIVIYNLATPYTTQSVRIEGEDNYTLVEHRVLTTFNATTGAIISADPASYGLNTVYTNESGIVTRQDALLMMNITPIPAGVTLESSNLCVVFDSGNCPNGFSCNVSIYHVYSNFSFFNDVIFNSNFTYTALPTTTAQMNTTRLGNYTITNTTASGTTFCFNTLGPLQRELGWGSRNLSFLFKPDQYITAASNAQELKTSDFGVTDEMPWLNASWNSSTNSVMNITFYNGLTGGVLGTSNNVANGSTVSINWSGLLTGTYGWILNIKTASENRNFSNFTFTVIGSSTIGPYCTTNGLLNISNITNGQYDLTVYNISSNTFYNQSVTSYAVSINASESYWQNLQFNTYQARLYLSAFKLFLNTTISSITGVAGAYANATTNGVLFLAIDSGTQTIQVSSPGNYSRNYTVSITGLADNYFNATGVYDAIIAIGAVYNNSLINNYTSNVSNTTLGAGRLYSNSTTNGTLFFPTLRGYTYYVDFASTTYSSQNTSIYTNNSIEYYNFSGYISRILNITFYDEETGFLVNTTNITLQLISTPQSANYTTSTGQVTTSVLTPADYQVRYFGNGYVNRLYQLTVSDSDPTNIQLPMLQASHATNVTVAVTDDTGRVLVGHTVKVLKYDIASNSYRTNQIVTTNVEGEALITIQLSTELYYFTVENDGQVLLITTPQYIYGTLIPLTVPSGITGFNTYFSAHDVGGIITYSSSSSTATFLFNDPDNSVQQGCINTYRYNKERRVLIETRCSNTSSGTVTSSSIDNSTGYYVFTGSIIKTSTPAVIATLVKDFNSNSSDDGNDKIGLYVMFFIIIATIFMMHEHLRWMVITVSAIPVLFSALGFIAIGLEFTIPVFLLGIVAGYLIGS